MAIFVELLLIGLSNGGIIALNAIAVTVIYSAARTLNLAHGDVYALSSVMTMVVLRTLLPLDGSASWMMLAGAALLALVATVLFGALLNGLVELLGFRMFRGMSRLAPVIATLGLSFIFYQAALVWRKLLPTYDPFEHRSVPGVAELPRDVVPAIFPKLDVLQALGIQTTARFDIKDFAIVVLAVVMTLLVQWLLHRTRIGRAIRACSQDSTAAQMVGVNLNGTIRTAFIIGGALAGVAAFIFATTIERPVANHGAQSGLIAFTAAILGGIGNPLGALLSSTVLGVFAAFSDYLIDGRWTPAMIYVLLVVLLWFRPSGLAAEERVADMMPPPGDVVVLNATRSSTILRPGMLLLNILPLALLYPLVVPLVGEYYMPLVNNLLIWVVLALGLTVLLGFAGVLDVGYAFSFAIGGYICAYLTGPAMAWRDQLLGFVPDGAIVLVIVVLVCGGLGVIKGLITARMRTDYLAIATMALALIMRDTLKNGGIGGVGGFSAIPTPILLGFKVDTFLGQYLFMLGIVSLLIIGSYRLLNSRPGRALAAMREDDYAAESSGVNVRFQKSLAFFIGDAVAGLAGCLYAMLLSYVEPDLADFQVSVMVLSMISIGGVGNIAGAVIGTMALLSMDRIVIPGVQALLESQQLIGFSFRELSYLLYGLALYLSLFTSRSFKSKRTVQ